MGLHVNDQEERDKEAQEYIDQQKQLGRKVEVKNGLVVIHDREDPDYDMSGPYL